MKYTRYDWKKKKNKGGDAGKVVIMVASIVVTAILLATVMGKFIFKPSIDGQDPKGKGAQEVSSAQGDNKEGTAKIDNKEQTPPVASGEKVSLAVVQCGVYSKEENAEEQKNTLKEKYNAFAVKDVDKFRVGVFIGDGQKGMEISKALQGEGINSMVAHYEIEKNNNGADEIGKIVDGYLQIVRKLEENDVKSVKTSDFKKWASSLKDDEKSEHIELIKEVKKEIASLPDELKRDNVEQSYKTIYKVLTPFRVK